MISRVLGGLVLAWFVGYARPGLAGCPNTCEVVLESVGVSPELACLEVEATTSTCDCGVHLVVTNTCTTELEAHDFTFRTCGASWQERRGDCSALAPGENGVTVVKAAGDGLHAWSLTLRNDGVDHVVGVQADVSSFAEPGCGCPFVTGSARREQAGARFALLGIPLLWRAHRRRRR